MSQVAWKNERNVHSVTFIRLIFFPHRTGRTQGIPTGRCISTVSTVQTNTCACQRLNMWRRARPEFAFNPRLVPYAQGKKERSRGRNGRRCNFEICCTKREKSQKEKCLASYPVPHTTHLLMAFMAANKGCADSCWAVLLFRTTGLSGQFSLAAGVRSMLSYHMCRRGRKKRKVEKK